jgi:hypothetical protein
MASISSTETRPPAPSLLDSQTEQSASNAFGEMDPKAEIFSDKSKLLILMHLYLELRLNVEHAAAQLEPILSSRLECEATIDG